MAPVRLTRPSASGQRPVEGAVHVLVEGGFDDLVEDTPCPAGQRDANQTSER